MKELDYGKAYQYDHDFEHHYSYQKYFPDKMAERPTIHPGNMVLNARSPNGWSGGRNCVPTKSAGI
jgi:replication-associated recombination protein RarA